MIEMAQREAAKAGVNYTKEGVPSGSNQNSGAVPNQGTSSLSKELEDLTAFLSKTSAPRTKGPTGDEKGVSSQIQYTDISKIVPDVNQRETQYQNILNRGVGLTANNKTAQDTLNLSRAADALNNRLYYRPGGLGSFGVWAGATRGASAGQWQQMPQIQTAETRAQGRQEALESGITGQLTAQQAAIFAEQVDRNRAEFNKNLDTRVKDAQYRAFLNAAADNYINGLAYMQVITGGAATLPNITDWVAAEGMDQEYKRLSRLYAGRPDANALIQEGMANYSARTMGTYLKGLGTGGLEAIKELTEILKGR